MSGPFDHVEDHAAEIPELLLTQFRGKPRIEDLAKALTSGVQGTEDAIHEVATERALSSAEGTQLDGVGEIVGRGRAGLSDDAYRAVLRAQVRVLLSSGTGEELLTIARLIMGADAPGPVTWLERYPAAGAMVVDEVTPVAPSIMVEMLQAARTGGVRLVMEFPPTSGTQSNAFELDSADEWPRSHGGHGLGGHERTLGGRLYDVRE
ncbi:MAG: DUF2612 domain-containing protein [Myxococcota bacterium]